MYDYRCTCLLDKRKKCEARIPQRLLNVWWHTAENLWYLHLLVVLIPYCVVKHKKGAHQIIFETATCGVRGVVVSQDRSIHDTVVYSPGVLHI